MVCLEITVKVRRVLFSSLKIGRYLTAFETESIFILVELYPQPFALASTLAILLGFIQFFSAPSTDFGDCQVCITVQVF